MKTLLLTLLISFVSVSVLASQAPDPKAPKAPDEHAANASRKTGPARVYFKNLKLGQQVPKKFRVEFGVEGAAIKPAGEMVPGAGHHHLVIDGDAVPAGQVVPMDETHLHFGKGQTEAEIELKPGKHKLVLQFADGAHVSYGPEMAATVDIVVR